MIELFLSILLSMVGATLLALMFRFVGHQPVRWRFFVAALGSLLAYWAVVVAGAELQGALPLTAGLKWNWLGKAVTTCVVLAALLALPSPLREKSGLRIAQQEGSIRPALLAIALLCAFSWGVEAWFNDGRDLSWERLAFQAIMPGLDEELFFRGLFLALLLCTFDEKWQLFGAPIGAAAAVATFIFAAGHGLVVAGGELHFNATAFAVTGALGFGLLWVRMRTGSIVLAVLAHNLINVGNSFF